MNGASTVLVVDNRQELRAEPGLHALIVGISAYPNLRAFGEEPAPHHLGLTQVSGPALSAWRLAEFLKARSPDHQWCQKLKTLRLMVLPDAADGIPANSAATPPTQAAFKAAAHDWREDANDDPNSIALLYFAGHGLQDGAGESLMVLADFGAGPGESFDGCACVANVFAGMTPSSLRGELARTQFFFIDSCRLRPEVLDRLDLGSAPNVFGLELDRIENRTAAPIIFAAKHGTPALTRQGEPTYFGEALLQALRRGATQAVPDPKNPGRVLWPVSTVPLAKAIEIQQRRLGRKPDLDRTGVFGDAPLLLLREAPFMDLEVRVDAGAVETVHDLALLAAPPSAVMDILHPVVPPPQSISIRAGIRQWRLRDNAGADLKSGIYNFTLDQGMLHVQL
ncbi:MAG: caspase family protein [Alphaproteobacteria bacterium]